MKKIEKVLTLALMYSGFHRRPSGELNDLEVATDYGSNAADILLNTLHAEQ